MKKLIITSIIALISSTMFAKNCHRPVKHHPAPPPPMHNHCHNRNGHVGFWSGFVTGSVIGGILNRNNTTVVQPVQNAVIREKMWIPGHYEDIVQKNGVIVRVWIPGRYIFM